MLYSNRRSGVRCDCPLESKIALVSVLSVQSKRRCFPPRANRGECSVGLTAVSLVTLRAPNGVTVALRVWFGMFQMGTQHLQVLRTAVKISSRCPRDRKSEARNSKQITIPNLNCPKTSLFGGLLAFVLGIGTVKLGHLIPCAS